MLTVAAAVCTRNRPELAYGCVARLLQCDPAPDEILVVDQSDGDRTRSLLATLTDPERRLRVVETGTRGVARARNIALAETTASVIAFTDDDCLVRENWIGAIRSAFSEFPEAAAVTGAVVPEPDAELDPRQRVATTWNPPGPRVHSRTAEPASIGASLNLAVRKDVLLGVGGFDERLGTGGPLGACEDSDAIHQILRNKAAVVYSPDVIIAHEPWRAEIDQVRTDRSYARGAGAWAALALRYGNPKPTGYWFRYVWVAKWNVLRAVGRLDGGAYLYHLSLIFWSIGGFARGLLAPFGRSPVLDRLTAPPGDSP